MRITLPNAKPCIECGSEPIYHRRDYVMLVIDLFLVPLISVIEGLVHALTPARRRTQDKPYLGIYELWEKLHLGEFLDAPDDKTMLLDVVLWEEAKKRGIVMREFRFLGLPTASFTARFPDGRRIAFDSVPEPTGRAAGVWWLDTKSEMKKRFMEMEIPVARGGAAYTKRGALKIFNSLSKPIIVKPFEGSGSRHTSMHINTETDLFHAFKVSQQITPLSIIEEELAGAVYRPTLVEGKLIATIRRDVPQVVGDDIHTIAELVDKENENPKRAGPYFSKILLDDAHVAELTRQNLTPESIPEAGKVVTLHPKINWSVGGTTTDVTDEVHPDNKKLFEHVAQILGAHLVGIDFIINDISKSWKEQNRCGIIECNSRPFFDNHHLPFSGQPRNVAAAIWDLVS